MNSTEVGIDERRRCGESDDEEDMMIGACCIRALRFRLINGFIAMWPSQIMSGCVGSIVSFCVLVVSLLWRNQPSQNDESIKALAARVLSTYQ